VQTPRQRTIQRVHDRYIRHIFREVQREILDAVLSHRLTSILGARQVVGKTAVTSYAAICLALGVEWKGQRIPAHDVHVVSRSERTSQDFVHRIGRILDAFQVGVGRHRAKRDSLRDQELGSMSRIALANGRRIFAHSGNPDSIQGFPGSVIVDEIGANRNDPEEILAQALSVTATSPDWRCLLIGNSSTRGDWWHKWWESRDGAFAERRAGWAMVKHDVHDVFGEILPAHLVEIRESMSDRDWRRWFLCEFVDAFNRAVSDEDLEIAAMGTARTEIGAPIVLGIDPGLNRNPTGAILARVGGFALDVLSAEYWFGPTSPSSDSMRSWTGAQLERIDQLVRVHRPSKIVCDHSNLASALGDALKSRYGGMVELVATTHDTRQRRWGALSSLLADGRISIPAGGAGADLRSDLTRLEIDDAQRFGKLNEFGRLVLPSITSPSGTHVLHCDIADALMLACEFVHLEPVHDIAIRRPETREAADPVEPIGTPPAKGAKERKRRGGFGWE